MGIVLTFLPWLIFWIILSYDKLFIAIAVALAASVTTIVMERMAGRSAKVLQAGTFAVFVVFGLTAVLINHVWLHQWIRLLSAAALTFIVFVSILIGKPFTIQYARESVPKEFWNRPEFLRANYIITWVWLAAFMINTAATVLDRFIPSINVVVNYVISISPFIGATMFTTWYRTRGMKVLALR